MPKACLFVALKVFLVVHGLQPLVGSPLTRNFHREMENQLSRRRTVPVLYARGNIHYIARAQLLCQFAPFLAKPSANHADENLPAAAF